MTLQKFIDALREKWSAIRQFFAPVADDEAAVPNDGNGSDSDGQPKSAHCEETEKIDADELTDGNGGSAGAPSEPRENKGIEKQPWRIPGRRGPGSRPHTARPETADKQISPPETKPELICRETPPPQLWKILLVLPEGHGATVRQGSVELAPEADGAYPLLDFSTPVTVTAAESEQNKSIGLFDGVNPLIFKLRKDWKGDGREVKKISKGCYLAFAPLDWQRDGAARVAPSECVDKNFWANYFFVDGSGDAGGFKERPFVHVNFSLDGAAVPDDADDSDYGDLFFGEYLELAGIDGGHWQDVSWVRVGEEGGGRWGKNFKPTEKRLSEVLRNREGWLYVRVYDNAVNRIDSFAFRRLVGLKKILVNGEVYSPENIIVPAEDGHDETVIQFVGVQARSESPHIMEDGGTFRIAAHPDADETRWKLTCRNGHTPARIHLPRVWWRLNNNGATSEWCDVALEMTRDEFYEKRGATMLVRLPVAADGIDVGFSSFHRDGGARAYGAVKDGDVKQAEFRLRDFCNHKEIRKSSATGTVLRIRCGTAECALIKISADAPQPEPEEGADPVQKSAMTGFFRPTTKNKRFSCAEIKAAGLTLDGAKRRKILVDTRRKTMYNDNMIALQEHFGAGHAD